MQQIIITIATWLAATALVNLTAHHSQIDAWCERRPKLAAVLKVLRGIGLDPWLLVQGVTLALRGKLPAGLRPEPVEVDVPVPEPSTLRSGSVLLLLLAPLLLVGCPQSLPTACAPESALAEIEARYIAETMAACRQYESAVECPGQSDRSARFRAERDEWATCTGDRK